MTVMMECREIAAHRIAKETFQNQTFKQPHNCWAQFSQIILIKLNACNQRTSTDFEKVLYKMITIALIKV